MGIGGGIITRKLLFAVLLVSSLSLMGIASANAADVGITKTQIDNNSAVQEKANIQTNNTDNVNESITTQNSVSGNTQNTTQTSDNAQKQGAFENQRFSMFAEQSSATGKIENFSMLQIKNLQAAAGETKTTSINQIKVTPISFTTTQIRDAAAKVKAYVETHHKLPDYVTIGTTQVKMPDFLKLLAAGLLQLNNKTTKSITLKTVGVPAQSSENITSGKINKASYLNIAKRINVFINANGVLPNYVTSTLGKLRYESLIYMYSKIFSFYKTHKILPGYVTVNAWISITKSITKARPIYITSDNINGAAVDMNRVNAIINGLKALGLTAVNWGIGPNKHYSVLQDTRLPVNALIVNIYGGACAGTIYEMGLSYYKKLIGTKKVFSVWVPPATDITGLSWLPRARDDTWDPASFTGLAHPDQYLKNNGYHYIYSGNINAIITTIYKEATAI